MALGKNIKFLRESRGWTFSQLSEASGVDIGTINALEKRDSKRSEYATQLCNALGVSVEDAMTRDFLSLSSNIKLVTAKIESNVTPGPGIRGRVPLISWVQAGMWSEAVDVYEPGYAEQWLPVLKTGDHAYALRVRGDSMTAPHGRSYPDGTIIIVDPMQRSPSSGQRVIAKLAESHIVTFKVFVEEDGRRWLKPLNSAHAPITDEFEVLGTVTAKYEPE